MLVCQPIHKASIVAIQERFTMLQHFKLALYGPGKALVSIAYFQGLLQSNLMKHCILGRTLKQLET